jgi:mannuronan 5-epimerase
MSAETGSFLLSFGTVSVKGATLRGNAGKNPVLPEFQPFLLVAGQGMLHAEGATFEKLGFEGPSAFRGVTVLSEGLMKPPSPPLIVDSQFNEVRALGLAGTDGAVIARNQFDGALTNAIAITSGTNLTIRENRITGTGAGAGIRISGDLNQIDVLANLVRDGGRNGIQIDGGREGLTVSGNVILGNGGAGLAVANATCAVIDGNIIAQNRTNGLRLRASGAATVTQNALFQNGSAGIEVQAHIGLAALTVSDNTLRNNREGFSAAGIGEVHLAANDLAVQTPRQFSGDFAPYLAGYLASEDEAAFVIPAASGAAKPAPITCATE